MIALARRFLMPFRWKAPRHLVCQHISVLLFPFIISNIGTVLIPLNLNSDMVFLDSHSNINVNISINSPSYANYTSYQPTRSK